MIRPLIALFVCALAATAANAQSPDSSITSPESAKQIKEAILDKPELLRRVAVYKAASHSAPNAAANT
jgi:hypothetical protein